jgi:hypothetical protein
LSPEVERRNIFSDSKHRPGDVTLPNWTGGRPLAIDVAVTSPFSAAGLRATEPAEAYSHTHKHGKFQSRFRGKSCLFAALVMESTGGLTEEALSLLKAIYRFGSKQQNVQHSVYAGRAWARLSCNLQTSVAQAILCRIDGWELQRRVAPRSLGTSLASASSSFNGTESTVDHSSSSESVSLGPSSLSLSSLSTPTTLTSSSSNSSDNNTSSDTSSCTSSSSSISSISGSNTATTLTVPTPILTKTTVTDSRGNSVSGRSSRRLAPLTPPALSVVPASRSGFKHSPSFTVPPMANEPCPCSPAEVESPLLCEFSVGPIPVSCTECVLGVLVCSAHLLTCGSLHVAQRCKFCSRLLCADHADCFCLTAEQWRDEEKESKNQALVSASSARIEGPAGGSSSLSAFALSFRPSQEPSSSSCSWGSGTSVSHSVLESSGFPASPDRRATAREVNSPSCTKTGSLSPSFPAFTSSSLPPSTSFCSTSHSQFRTSSSSVLSFPSSGTGSSNGSCRDSNVKNQVSRPTTHVSRSETERKESGRGGNKSKHTLVRTSSALSPHSGGVGRSRFLAGASLSLPSSSFPPPSSSAISSFDSFACSSTSSFDSCACSSTSSYCGFVLPCPATTVNCKPRGGSSSPSWSILGTSSFHR